MNPRTILTLLLVFVAPACVVPNPLAEDPVEACIIPCWGFTQAVEDADTNGRFDGECVRHSLPDTTFAPNLPPSGKFHGRHCVKSQAHDNSVRKVINAIKTGTWEGVSETEVYNYLFVVENDGPPPVGIDIDAWNRCVEWLELQDCETADSPGREQTFGLCYQFVRTPINLTLTDLTGCNWSPPTKDPPLYVHPESNACVYIVTYDGISIESGSGDGDGACFDETSPGSGDSGGSDGGSSYGESTGEESEENEAPFGDLAESIAPSCLPRKCTARSTRHSCSTSCSISKCSTRRASNCSSATDRGSARAFRSRVSTTEKRRKHCSAHWSS